MVINGNRALITGRAMSYPPSVSQDDLWTGFFSDYFDNSRLARLAFASSGIGTRHAVVNPLDDDISRAGTGLRMERFLTEATPLGKDAVTRALHEAGLHAADIGFFAIVTCTGYSTPGIDVVLARDLGMSSSLQRVLLGHIGCHGAIPGLQMAANHVAANGIPALVLSIELPSLHLQPKGTGVDQVIPNTLFSDAAVAFVLEKQSDDAHGLELVDFLNASSVAHMDYLSWQITDHGFRMNISRRVPDVIATQASGAIGELLAKNHLTMDDVTHWAVHPGGPRVLETVATSLQLDRTKFAASDAVLHHHGNCSSATVMMVMDEIASGTTLVAGDVMVALAFGPGLTCAAALLRAQ